MRDVGQGDKQGHDASWHASPIFRQEAVRAYLENRRQVEVPRFSSPRTFLVLWILTTLLLAVLTTTLYLLAAGGVSGPGAAQAARPKQEELAWRGG